MWSFKTSQWTTMESLARCQKDLKIAQSMLRADFRRIWKVHLQAGKTQNLSREIFRSLPAARRHPQLWCNDATSLAFLFLTYFRDLSYFSTWWRNAVKWNCFMITGWAVVQEPVPELQGQLLTFHFETSIEGAYPGSINLVDALNYRKRILLLIFPTPTPPPPPQCFL